MLQTIYELPLVHIAVRVVIYSVALLLGIRKLTCVHRVICESIGTFAVWAVIVPLP